MSALNPDLISELRSKGFEVITMGHAYRINGCVDIFFTGRTVYDKEKNQYHNLATPKEGLSLCLRLASGYGVKDAFSKTSKGRMSYQEFKHKKQDQPNVAEYYHWSNDTESSDDDLYFIQSGVYVKIGRSYNPQKRIKELATGIAEVPKLLLIVRKRGHMERVLHRCFSQFRIRKDAEWFYLSDDIQKFISFLWNQGKKDKSKKTPVSQSA